LRRRAHPREFTILFGKHHLELREVGQVCVVVSVEVGTPAGRRRRLAGAAHARNECFGFTIGLARTQVAEVAVTIAVCVCLVDVGIHWAVIARIAESIFIGIGLLDVGINRAVVAQVAHVIGITILAIGACTLVLTDLG
jgi:hypothetical protein